MARDHRRLRVFHDAHSLVLAIYKETRNFPRDEWYGLRAQVRRAAVSVPSNIVEGNARRGTGEYLNFLNIARGSAAEVAYLVGLSCELGYLRAGSETALHTRCDQLIPGLEALIHSMERITAVENERRLHEPRTRNAPKTSD